MKKSIKKVMALSLGMSMVAMSLSACGGSSASSEGATNGASEDGDKVITFWNAGTSEVDKAVYDKAIELFNTSTDSGYTIEMTGIANDVYKEKITIAMSSGECPDIYTSWSGGPMIEYVESGYAKPVTEVFSGTEAHGKILDAALAQATYNGELYAIPFFDISISGIFYNKEIFDKYGLEVPTTISELESISDTLVTNGVTPFALANATKWTGSMYFMNLAARNGGLEPFSKAVAGDGTFEDESFIYAGEKIQEWVEKGYFPDGVNSMDEDSGQARQLLYQDAAAMSLIGSWYAGTIKSESEEYHAKTGWFPFPAMDGKEENASIAIGTVGDQFASFNCEGEKLEAAVEFISIFTTDEMVEFIMENGKVPPIKGAPEAVTDPILSQVMEFVNSAEAVQLWYDQYLPPSVAQVHLDTCQSLFGLSKTPSEVAAEFEAAMEEELAE